MKKLFAVLFLVAWVGGTQASWALDVDLPLRVDTQELIQDDRIIPLPWSLQKTFPWSLIQGTWLAQSGGFESYFVFKSSKASLKQLDIRQVDVVTCKPVAAGIGITNKSGKTLGAEMFYFGHELKYRMMVRSYNYGGPIKDINVYPIDGQVVVLSILPPRKNEYVHLVLTKVSGDTRINSTCKGRGSRSSRR